MEADSQKEEIRFDHYPSFGCVQKVEQKKPDARLILPDGKEIKEE